MYLPTPPDSIQKLLYLDSGRKKLYSLSAVSTLILVIGMLLFVRSNPYFIPYTVFSFATIIYLSMTYAVGLFGKDFDYLNHILITNKHFHRAANEEVDIYLPICGESLDVIANTWKAVQELRHAHEGNCRVHVLDDGKSLLAASLADKMNFNYIQRPTNELKKAGNLRHAFTKTTAPYFIIFDADFAPRKDFLLNTLPYFYENKKVGIVQTPQFFEVNDRMNEIQKGASSIQELFYRLIQVSRDYFSGAICVGSNGIYSRKHFEQFQGTADIGYSEDVRSSYRLTAFGDGIVKYIPLNLAAGLCPDNWQSLFTQYYRWSLGSIDLMLAKEFWRKGLNKMQRVCYMTGMMYYTVTGLSVAISPLPSIYLLIYRPDLIHWFNLLFSLPSLFLSTVYMKMWQKHPYGIFTLRVRHVSFFAHLYAFKDKLLNTLESWQVTGAKTTSQRYESFKVTYKLHTLAIPLIILSLVLFRISQGYEPHNYILLITITAFNFFIAFPVIRQLK